MKNLDDQDNWRIGHRYANNFVNTSKIDAAEAFAADAAFDGAGGFGSGGMNMDDIFSQFGDIFGGAFGGFGGFGGGSQRRSKGTNLRIKVSLTIAEIANGAYYEGNDTELVLDFVEQTLKEMDKKEFEAKKFVSYKDQFQIFLLIAFSLLLSEVFIFETKTRWVQKLNLFNEK